MSGRLRLRRLVGWAGFLVAASLVIAVGRGRLAMPAPWHLGIFVARFRSDGAAVGGVAVLRQVVLLAGAYLALLGLLAEISHRPRLGRMLRPALHLPLPGFRSVVRLLGVPGLVAGATVMSATAAGAEPVTGGPPARVWLSSPPARSAPPLVAPGAAAATPSAPVLRWLPPLPPSPTPASTPPPPSPPRTTPAPTTPAPTTPASTTPAFTTPAFTTPAPTTPPAITPARTTPAPASPAATPSPATPAPASLGPTSASPAPPPATPPPAGSPASTSLSLPATPPPTAAAPPLSPSATAAQATPPAPPSLAAAAPPQPIPSAAQAPAQPTPGRSYRLKPGDHLWKVADDALTAHLGHPPRPEDLGRYWWQVVEVNRHRLPDPANPDFVLPGLLVVLPALA